MNCESCREVFSSYFDQTLTESLRFDTCEHLLECADCRASARAKRKWEGEFLDLNNLAVPEDWLKRWTPSASRVPLPFSEREVFKAPVKNVQSYNARVSGAWKFWAAGACLFLASTFLVFKYFPAKTKEVPKISAPAPVSGQTAAEESEALRELNEIAKRFGIKLDADGQPVYVPGKVLESGIEIKPLHAHLKFSSESSAASFEKWIYSLEPEEVFSSTPLWAVSFNRAQLLAFIEGVKARNIKLEGNFLQLSNVPIFDGQIRVSFVIEREFQASKALRLFQHWHFMFELHNRFELLEKLKSSGVKMLYEAPEVWVFEIPASKLKGTMEIIDSTMGMKKELVHLEKLPDSGNFPVKISVYLKGR